MPALPGTHLVFVHAHLAFASFEARFNASASLDHPCQFPQRRLRECSRTPRGRREVVMVAVALVLIGSIPRGTGLPCPVVREGPPGDDQPFLRSRAFALEPCLYPAPDHRHLHRPFLAVSYRQVRPRIARECLAPLRHRLPRSLGGASTPCIRGQRGLEGPHRGMTGDPQDITLISLA